MTMMEMMLMEVCVQTQNKVCAVVLLGRIHAGSKDSLCCFLSPGTEESSGGKVRTYIFR